MRAHRPPHRSAVAPPRRRHPARVYWVRRLLALSVVAAVVVGLIGLGRLVTGAGDGGTGDDRAAAAAAEPGESPSADTGDGPTPGSPADSSAGERSGAGAKPGGRGKPTAPPAEPDGPCEPEDVLVSPSVRKAEAVGGSPVTIRLDLTTISSEACDWVVSPETMTLRVTRGGAEVWSTRQCPEALTEEEVVVRQERRKRVRVEWSTKLFDEECAIQTGWARLGTYGLEAAALAGEPREGEFELVKPRR